MGARVGGLGGGRSESFIRGSSWQTRQSSRQETAHTGRWEKTSKRFRLGFRISSIGTSGDGDGGPTAQGDERKLPQKGKESAANEVGKRQQTQLRRSRAGASHFQV